MLRPVAPGDEAELLRIHRLPEVRRWWDEPAAGFPFEDDPETMRFTIEVDGAVAGLIQFWEEPEPNFRHAGIDVFLDPALRGRGLGTEAVRRIVRLLIDERGHHRITIDPAVGERRRDPLVREGRLQAGRRDAALLSATPTATAGTTGC